MKHHFITFGTDSYLSYATELSTSAKEIAKFEYTRIFTKENIDDDFLEKNKHIFQCSRGYGYWLWKSYIIYKYLIETDIMEENDVLCYCDSMYLFNGRTIKEIMDEYPNDIIITHNKPNEPKYYEKEYSKGDAFYLMDALDPQFSNSYQAWGGFIILRKTPSTINFVKTWLEYAQDIRIIDDNQGLFCDNHSEFKENRHDQTVLSLLAKKNNIDFIEFPHCFLHLWTFKTPIFI